MDFNVNDDESLDLIGNDIQQDLDDIHQVNEDSGLLHNYVKQKKLEVPNKIKIDGSPFSPIDRQVTLVILLQIITISVIWVGGFMWRNWGVTTFIVGLSLFYILVGVFYVIYLAGNLRDFDTISTNSAKLGTLENVMLLVICSTIGMLTVTVSLIVGTIHEIQNCDSYYESGLLLLPITGGIIIIWVGIFPSHTHYEQHGYGKVAWVGINTIEPTNDYYYVLHYEISILLHNIGVIAYITSLVIFIFLLGIVWMDYSTSYLLFSTISIGITVILHISTKYLNYNALAIFSEGLMLIFVYVCFLIPTIVHAEVYSNIIRGSLNIMSSGCLDPFEKYW